MSSLQTIAIVVFILSLILVTVLGSKGLRKSSNDVGGGNILRSIVFISAAITIVITLFIKYVVL